MIRYKNGNNKGDAYSQAHNGENLLQSIFP